MEREVTEGSNWSPDFFDELESTGTGMRIEDFDAAVAAHAKGCVLVTANLKHMTRVPGLQVEGWSEQLET
jgi:predicted nucleic acid-binding protein